MAKKHIDLNKKKKGKKVHMRTFYYENHREKKFDKIFLLLALETTIYKNIFSSQMTFYLRLGTNM